MSIGLNVSYGLLAEQNPAQPVLLFGFVLILPLVCLISRWLVITSVLFLLLLSLGLVSQILWHWLEAPWQRKHIADAASAPAIVVLSGGSDPAQGTAKVSEWHDPDRFLAGFSSNDKAKHLVCCLPANELHGGQGANKEHRKNSQVV